MKAVWNNKPLARVFFQGRQLPPFAITLDVAANNGVFEDLCDETARWFWHFAICVGAVRRDKAVSVQTHAMTLARTIANDGHKLLPEIRKRFPDAEADVILSDWVESLRIIYEEAEGLDECEWWAE
jgi:hypothetical protein